MNKQTPPLLTYLEGKGITLQSLIDSALEMYVPHPGVETPEKAAEMLKEEFLDILQTLMFQLSSLLLSMPKKKQRTAGFQG